MAFKISYNEKKISEKILGQIITDGITNTHTVYTVPISTTSELSSLLISNNTLSSASYKLGVVKESDIKTKEISNLQTIIPIKIIAAGETDEIVGDITLSAGDQIRVYSETANLVVHVYGTEIS